MRRKLCIGHHIAYGKIEWIKPHLAEEGKTVFKMSAELISTLIPND